MKQVFIDRYHHSASIILIDFLFNVKLPAGILPLPPSNPFTSKNIELSGIECLLSFQFIYHVTPREIPVNLVNLIRNIKPVLMDELLLMTSLLHDIFYVSRSFPYLWYFLFCFLLQLCDRIKKMAQIEARKMTRTQVHEKFKENFNALCNRCPHLVID